jgi:hypothetical protein
VGGQGEHGGTFAFVGGAVTDELELVGVRRLSFPCPMSPARGSRLSGARGRKADAGRAGVGPRWRTRAGPVVSLGL